MHACLRLLALLLIWQLIPGLTEVVENGWHLAIEGHGAHALADLDHTPSDEEHGCTGTDHICSCHASASGIVGDGARLAGPRLVDDRWIGRSLRPVEPAAPRLDRPPRVA